MKNIHPTARWLINSWSYPLAKPSPHVRVHVCMLKLLLILIVFSCTVSLLLCFLLSLAFIISIFFLSAHTVCNKTIVKKTIIHSINILYIIIYTMCVWQKVHYHFQKGNVPPLLGHLSFWECCFEAIFGCRLVVGWLLLCFKRAKNTRQRP